MSASRNTAIRSPTEPRGPARRHPRPLLVAMAHARMRIQPAFAAYVLWRETQLPDALDDAFHRALPVIGRVVILHFATRGDVIGLDEDDLVSVAAADLHGALARGGYTGMSPYEYYGFLRGVARRAVMKELNKNRRRVYDYASRCSKPPAGRLPSTHDMEFRIFLERLPRCLFRQTRTAILASPRLADDTERAVSLHVLVRLLSGRLLLRPGVLAAHFGVTKPRARFLIDWTTVTLRRQLYALRELHGGTVLGDWHDLADLYEPEVSAEDGNDEDEETWG
jgi:hypothetical protein